MNDKINNEIERINKLFNNIEEPLLTLRSELIKLYYGSSIDKVITALNELYIPIPQIIKSIKANTITSKLKPSEYNTLIEKINELSKTSNNLIISIYYLWSKAEECLHNINIFLQTYESIIKMTKGSNKSEGEGKKNE